MSHRVRFTLVLNMLAFALAAPAYAQQATPLAALICKVKSEATDDVIALTLEGITATNGKQFYTAFIASPDGSWTLDFACSVDWRADPLVEGSCLTEFINYSATAQTLDLSFDVAICPAISGGSLAGAVTTIALNSFGGEEPGVITCPEPKVGGIVTLQADGATVKDLFPCPFNLVTGTSGSGSSSWTWGAGPLPSGPGPAEVGSIGFRHYVTLSAGDSCALQPLVFKYKALSTNDTGACAADIVVSGTVDGQDLGELLACWGQVTECFAPVSPCDLNQDLKVDAADLAILLGAWGECPTE